MPRYIVVAVLFVVAVAPAFSRHRRVCISWRDATDPCPVNETMSLCGRLCEPTCESTKATSVTPLWSIIERCPPIECTQETMGCRCEEDFVRNEQGMCVDSDDCPE
ncbi:chymotrypsin inhibitor-like [Andrena cerasifolii]|uniref:chymotrypsin inhibitor-like n=1 Tax=Andrena cerasifolii TaxID=2819439 RepID=UPI004038039D